MLWSIGLIYTHYAATYVFGFTLLLCWSRSGELPHTED